MNKTKRLARAILRAISEELFTENVGPVRPVKVQGLAQEPIFKGQMVQTDDAPGIRWAVSSKGGVGHENRRAQFVAEEDQEPVARFVDWREIDDQAKADAEGDNQAKWEGQTDLRRYPDGVPSEVVKLRQENEKLREQVRLFKEVDGPMEKTLRRQIGELRQRLERAVEAGRKAHWEKVDAVHERDLARRQREALKTGYEERLKVAAAEVSMMKVQLEAARNNLAKDPVVCMACGKPDRAPVCHKCIQEDAEEMNGAAGPR